jgi:hypothetical protein
MDDVDAPAPWDPDQISLTSLDVVKAQVPAVRRARDVVIEQMEGMVISGLANLVSKVHPPLNPLAVRTR